jgi:hypothetical protein
MASTDFGAGGGYSQVAVSKARDVTPDHVRSGWGSVVHSARERPLPLALGGAFLFGPLRGQSRRRRQ